MVFDSCDNVLFGCAMRVLWRTYMNGELSTLVLFAARELKIDGCPGGESIVD